MLSRVAGMVLAAGAGRRVGGAKALLRYGDELLVDRAVATLRDVGCAPVVVVLGAEAARVQSAAELIGATVVVNSAWSTGVGSSLRAGLKALHESDAEAVVVLLVDMPGVTPAAVARVAALPYRQALVCATYAGRRDHPMLFGRDHWGGISTLANADVGARPYLIARAADVLEIACDNVADGIDIDTEDAALGWGVTLPAPRAVVHV